MLQKSTIDFLSRLKKNNDREWFEKHRSQYLEAKDDFTGFIDSLIKSLQLKNKKLEGLEAKDCVFRIFRDVRFSKNKAPYKPNFGASISEGGKKSPKAGFYIHIEPGGNSFVAGGCWMPESSNLKAIRQEIDYNFKDFSKILKSRNFSKYFNGLSDCRLKTNPKGYYSDNPAIDHLRQTSFIIETGIKDNELHSKTFLKKSAEIYSAMLPLLNFLNTGMS